MTDNATPRPWHLALPAVPDNPDYDNCSAIECTATGEVIIDSIDDANAQIIVTAVNAHDDLLAAAKDIVDFLDELIVRPYEHAVIKQLRVAIAKAEGAE